MISKLIPAMLFTCLFCFVSCEDEQTPIVTVDENAKTVKVSNVKNCETSILNYEKEGSVNIYPIDDRYDYSFKSDFTNYKIGADGNYSIPLEDGYYYFEALNKSGVEIINGTFEIPEDLNKSGALVLSRVDKGGFAWERLPDGNPGKKITNVEITHIHEITGLSYVTHSDANGQYCIDLNPGRYRIIATHPDYITEDSGAGFNVFDLDDEANRTANVIMKKK